MTKKHNFKFDIILALAVFFLVMFGLVMITSIGVTKSIDISTFGHNILYPSCSDELVDCYLLFKKHLVRLIIGVFTLYISFRLPMRFWKKISALMFIGTIFVLIFVFVAGKTYGTIASSWVTLFDTSIQPSEFAKLSLVLYLAYWFSKRKGVVESFGEGFIPFCIMSGLVVVPVILQNDFGSTLVIALTAVSVYIIAGAKTKHLAIGFFLAIMSVILVATNVEHVSERFKGFLSSDQECAENYCWQSQQANIAIGSGGFWGKGLTQGVQKSYWLPQASDDFIFAASSEELGFIRIILVVLAYFLIALRGYSIANHAKNNFEMYVAVGITTWIVVQAFINIAVNTALMPVTGITLPFVSYGGSSLVSSLIGIGILLNISQTTTHHARSIHRRGNRRSRHTQLRRYRRA